MSKVLIYMNMAREIAKLSPDAETKVGSIMLSKEGRVIASSFNGFLRGAPDHLLPNTRPGKYEYMQHSERNMIYNCDYNGISTRDTSIICTLSPCVDCVRAVFQSGVTSVIYDKLYSKFKNKNMYLHLDDINITIDSVEGFTRLNLKKAVLDV